MIMVDIAFNSFSPEVWDPGNYIWAFCFFYAPTSLEATKSDTPWEVGLICKHCIYVYIDINPGVEVVTDCEII